MLFFAIALIWPGSDNFGATNHRIDRYSGMSMQPISYANDAAGGSVDGYIVPAPNRVDALAGALRCAYHEGSPARPFDDLLRSLDRIDLPARIDH